MGRKSTRENKNIYFTSRLKADFTSRESAAEATLIPIDRIVKIETDVVKPRDDEVLKMAECYKNPLLCNYFCVHDCKVGERTVNEISEKSSLSQISLKMLVSLNDLEKLKNRLAEITVDEKVTEDELDDFLDIKNKLDYMAEAIESLKIWINDEIIQGQVEKDYFKK